MAGEKQKGSWFGGGGVRPADEEDLFSYFSARCYSGYGDDKQVTERNLVRVQVITFVTMSTLRPLTRVAWSASWSDCHVRSRKLKFLHALEALLVEGPCLLLLKQGFYAVYDTLFEKLVQQEVRFAEKSGKHLPEDLANAPHFGEGVQQTLC